MFFFYVPLDMVDMWKKNVKKTFKTYLAEKARTQN